MKTLSLLLIAAGACALVGCGQDEYVYHNHTTAPVHHYGGDTVAGEPSHMSDPNTAESFRAESNAQ